jgi:Tol biopolymer transport system component
MIDKPDPVVFDRIPMQISWLNDSSGIIFNTELKVDYGMHSYNDLWYADIEDGTIEQVLADGSGGSFAISPDSTAIIVADHESVSMVDANFGGRTVLLSFPVVNTASEFAFIPMPVWAPDSSYALVAIPDPEPYEFNESLPDLEIWKIYPSEEAALQCTVSGYNLWDAMSGDLLSPDGLHFAYATGHFPYGDVHIARLDGTIVNTFDYAYDFMGWSTDGSLIILYADSPFLGGLEIEQQELDMHEEVWAWNAYYIWVSPSVYVGLDFSYFLETTALWVTEIGGQSRMIDYGCDSVDAVLLR